MNRFSYALMYTCALLSSLMLLTSAVAQEAEDDEVDEMSEFYEEGEDAEVVREKVIILNTNDPSYNAWNLVRKDLSEGREPGPIDVQRYEGGFPWIGIPTFFHLPVALTPADLEAGQVEVAIMGAELVGGMRARTWGPQEMRNPHKSEIYHLWGSLGMPELDSGITALNELTVVDYGDAPMEPLSLERTIPEVQKLVREIASVELEDGSHTVPIIIGGGHALMYPDLAGILEAHDLGPGKVAVVHFDAHQDYAPVGFGHLITHGNPIRALIRDGYAEGGDFIQVGLRGPTSTDVATLLQSREAGIRYHTTAEIEYRGFPAVMETVLEETKDHEYLFISFDVDVVDPAFIPGTATPEPGGLYMREVLPMMRRLCAENNIIGVEIVELKPDADPGYISVQNAKAVLRQCLNGMAMRKLGLTEPGYLNPVMKEHGLEP